jgi:hypothetical protein
LVLGTDVAVVRGWFGVRPRDWHQPTGQRFVVHTINETTVEQGGIELGANPRLAAELYPHLAEPVCQHSTPRLAARTSAAPSSSAPSASGRWPPRWEDPGMIESCATTGAAS